MGRVEIHKSFAGKRLLITGGNGFVGRHLLNHLHDSGSSITATRFGEVLPALLDGVEWRELDITDRNAVEKIVKEIQPQIVFHLGALLGAERTYEFSERALLTNTIGTNNLLSALGKSCSQLERVVLIGTSEEYGNGINVPFTEDLPMNPVSPYSASKAAATQFALLYHKLFQLPVVIIRPFILYGPFQSSKMMIPELINYGLDGRDFKMTKGEQTRDFLFVDDFIESILLAATVKEAIGEIFNICSGTEKSIREITELIHRLMNHSMKLQIGLLPYRINEVWRLFGNNEKAKRILGWQPTTSIEEGLRKTISSFATQREKQ